MKIFTDAQYKEKLNRTYANGFEDSKDQLESQEKTIKARNKRISTLEAELKELKQDHASLIEKLEAKIDVLESDRDDVREVARKEMENADTEAALQGLKEGLDKRTAKIKEREAQLDSEEESNFKKGYADGIADGLRKIAEITQTDRDNAMKIAMVSASSHTPVANLKELNNVHQITSGSTDKES